MVQVFTYVLNYDLAVVKHEFYFVNHTIHDVIYNVNHFFHCAQTIHVISYFVNSLMNTYLKDCLRCLVLAKHHPFWDGTLSESFIHCYA